MDDEGCMKIETRCKIVAGCIFIVFLIALIPALI